MACVVKPETSLVWHAVRQVGDDFHFERQENRVSSGDPDVLWIYRPTRFHGRTEFKYVPHFEESRVRSYLREVSATNGGERPHALCHCPSVLQVPAKDPPDLVLGLRPDQLISAVNWTQAGGWATVLARLGRQSPLWLVFYPPRIESKRNPVTTQRLLLDWHRGLLSSQSLQYVRAFTEGHLTPERLSMLLLPPTKE